MKIAIGCDHAGFPFKNQIVEALRLDGFEVVDFGTNALDSVDFPDFAHQVGKTIDDGNANWGIVICGSGNGVNMTVNKYPNVRGALCWLPEIARLARMHNDANIISIPARFVSLEMALEMINLFSKTPFEGGRHANRVRKIAC
jgi:ribose 5-phosphate isomerase B